MRYAAIALGFLLAAPVAAEPELVIHIDADRSIVQPGESVGYTIWAELFNPAGEILATIVEINFTLSFGGSDLVLSNNSFSPAFDSDFFGPADDGDIVGSSIQNAYGVNHLPPLNNADGPDSSNPLSVYSFTATVPFESTTSSYTPSIGFHTELSGAYVNAPFHDVFYYYHRLYGVVTPFRIEAETITVPAPVSITAFFGFGVIATRRRSR